MGETNFNWPSDMKEVDCYLVPKKVLKKNVHVQNIDVVNLSKFTKVKKNMRIFLNV